MTEWSKSLDSVHRFVVCSGGGPGMMEAGGMSIGLNISLPMEHGSNPYITPGGFGTLDELFEVLTLLQTEKVLKRLPIVIYGSEYWKQIINFDNMVKYGVISREDLDLIQFCDTVDEVFEYLKGELPKLYLKES